MYSLPSNGLPVGKPQKNLFFSGRTTKSGGGADHEEKMTSYEVRKKSEKKG